MNPPEPSASAPQDIAAASLSRRDFVGRTAGAMTAAAILWEPDQAARAAADDAPNAASTRQATGVRVGEMTDHSAVVWARLTASHERNRDGQTFPARSKSPKKGDAAAGPEVVGPVERLEGACPGAPGRVRLRYGVRADLSDATTLDWVEVAAADDFIHQFAIDGLKAGTTYHYEVETADSNGKTHGALRGEFRTSPPAASTDELTFCVMTCQGYPDRGHADGHPIYPAMLALKPAFACLTGDLVYYDNDAPRAVSAELARYHWQRMFSLPRLVEFNRRVGAYWLKDDHDTLNNDSWPGAVMGKFTFAEGQRIFRQQAPLRDGPSYRTFRWGRDLQIWLVDGRDHRSPNRMPDGPEKTIWGAEQKDWFQRTVKESDATWKVLVSPTPLVGPDRGGKNDNHSNQGYRHEGDELRAWIQSHSPENLFVVCGDRHWQYHSVHPRTGLNEFSVGAASDEHAGGTPGEDPNYHRFHRVKGGFLATTVRREGRLSTIEFQHRDVRGEVVYRWTARKESAVEGA